MTFLYWSFKSEHRVFFSCQGHIPYMTGETFTQFTIKRDKGLTTRAAMWGGEKFEIIFSFHARRRIFSLISLFFQYCDTVRKTINVYDKHIKRNFVDIYLNMRKWNAHGTLGNSANRLVKNVSFLFFFFFLIWALSFCKT